jgi:sodium-dependent dicarboxylate transporter 2/3/5
MTIKGVGFFSGIILFIIIVLLPPPQSFLDFSGSSIAHATINADCTIMASSMKSVLALLSLMVIWWVTEAVPLPATALLPALMLPIIKVTGISGTSFYEFTLKNTLLNYANPVIYLFLGGFLLAGSMQKWHLDKRIILWLLSRSTFANDTRKILLAIMSVTAFLSMWISNTATAAMMLPMGIGILTLINGKPGTSSFGTALMLGIAWAASIGGVGTIIGTPPNGIAVGILNSTFASSSGYHHINFFEWMLIGVPYVILMLPIAWFILLKFHRPEVIQLPGGKDRIVAERSALGRFSRGEKLTVAVFLFAVVLWLSNPFWDSLLPPAILQSVGWIDEYLIGLFCGTLLFFLPVDFQRGRFVLDWSDTKFVDWGTLILFGGGIALSDAMFKTGLAPWIATSFIGLFGTPSIIVLIFIVVVLMGLLTEVTSNTAVTTMMVPVVISISQHSGVNPTMAAVAAAIAASMAFMLPVATPPNALVYGTGHVTIKEMVHAGFALEVIGWFVTTLTILLAGIWIWGVF